MLSDHQRHRPDTTKQLICILSPEELPIEILAKIARDLSLADISRLLRTDKAFSRLAGRQDFIDLLRFMLNNEQLIIPIEKSDGVMEVLKQLDSLPEEEKQPVTMKRVIQKSGLNNLDSVIGKQELRHKILTKMWMMQCAAFTAIFVVSAIIAIPIYSTFGAWEASFSAGGVCLFFSASYYLYLAFPQMRQACLENHKKKLSHQFETNLEIDATTPLLKASISPGSYTKQKPATSPHIEEITDDLDEVLVDTQDYPLTRKGSMGQFAKKVVNEESYLEEERKDLKEYR